jgi:UDP-glucose 4-epimerase
MAILVTGGAGYIGSHTCVELLEAGYQIVVVDNLCNSSEESLQRVQRITESELTFAKVDLMDKTSLQGVFRREKIEAVIHFAGLKAVGESVEIPLRYYYNNITGTLLLCDVMAEFGVMDIVFSSSATVYGDPHSVPISEEFPVGPTNPYGWTKLMIEQILTDIQHANPEINVGILRYFNPVGAHPSGLIGEDPSGIPNNLMPFISQVAVGKLEKLNIYGDDYDTVDGTGVRDYIHVIDLAKGHLAALDKLKSNPGVCVYNLGTGRGISVFELVRAFESASNREIPYQVTDRRAGDIAESYADPRKANVELGWQAELGITEMCVDTWRWQSMNPNGYPKHET